MIPEEKAQPQRLYGFGRAEERGNVSGACREAGIFRARLCEFRGGILAAALLSAVFGATWALAQAPTAATAEGAPSAGGTRLVIAEVVDTASSLGPLSTTPRPVTLDDLVHFHGHACDGLIVAAVGIGHGLHLLFPDGPVDRTDVVVAVNRSACYGDVAAYLTGARHRYGSLVIDPDLGDSWVLHRRSTGATVRIALRPGLKPQRLPALEAALRAESCPQELMAEVGGLQEAFAQRVLAATPQQAFSVQRLESFPFATGELRPDAVKRDCLRRAEAETGSAGR